MDKKHKVSAAELQKYLKNVDYPLKKDKLITHAKKNGATLDVISVLQELPENEFNSPVDVSKAMGEIE